jgi:hypothetical protein
MVSRIVIYTHRLKCPPRKRKAEGIGALGRQSRCGGLGGTVTAGHNPSRNGFSIAERQLNPAEVALRTGELIHENDD